MISPSRLSVSIALLFAAFASTSAYAAKLGDINLDGFVLLETWVDSHNEREGQKMPSNQANAFTLHNIELWSERDLGAGQKFTWKLAHRNRNGNLGGSGSMGSREAWVGLEGNYGAVKVGRFLTKAWQVLDYPYGSPGWQAEPLAETGAADWVTVKAIRYTAPKIGALELEATYDTGNQSNSSRAALFEGFARYNAGPVVFDAIIQRKNNSPAQVGVGDFGGNDGGPDVKDNTHQGVYFVGARWQLGGGYELMGAYKRNFWHSDAGLNDLPQWGGRPATAGKDVHNARFLLGLNYTTGKWNINGAIQKIQAGNDSKLGNLNDGGYVIGGRIVREIAPATWLYFGIRHHRLTGKHTPVDAYPWQIQGDGSAASSNTRIGVGAQMLF